MSENNNSGKDDPLIHKSAFHEALCAMCMEPKPIKYNEPDKWNRWRGICQDCYNRLLD